MNLVFYTDGSLANNKADCGVYCHSLQLKLHQSIGEDITVFQSEVYAIIMTLEYCLKSGYVDKNITICSDSNAALSAMKSLNLNYSWSAVILPEPLVVIHSNIEGNERADELARKGSDIHFVGPWLAIPLSNRFFSNLIDSWTSLKQAQYWNNLNTCRETRLFLVRPQGKLSEYLLNLSKQNLKLFVGILTGHYPLNQHLFRIGLHKNSICDNCRKEGETEYHFVCICPSFAILRFKILRDFTLNQAEYKCLDPKKSGLHK
jgi:ribonuclease HI